MGLKVDILERRISTLTFSETKLLQFALAFLSNPKVILLDEPFRGLGLKTVNKLMRILTRLKDKFSKTILFIVVILIIYINILIIYLFFMIIK